MMRASFMVCALLMACGSRSESPPPAAAAGRAPTAGSAGVPSAGGGQGGASSSGAGGGEEAGAGSAGEPVGGSGALEPWPGPSEVEALPATGLILGNVSGLSYQPAAGDESAVLWATANIPGNLYRLLPSSEGGFASDSSNDWSAGKRLCFPSGEGAADAESVTLAATPGFVYVASEHDNLAASVSRMSILRYDTTDPGSSLIATHEWNVTSVLPAAGANLGIEAITWVSDQYLLERGFIDESRQAVYDPSLYPDNTGGVFFVGVEGTGQIYGFSLDLGDGSFQLVASISTPLAGVMSLEHDRDVGYLWFGCDNTCDNQTGVLEVDTTPNSATLGRFVVRRRFERPSGLPNSDNEGVAIGPESDCSGGQKPFFWTDDAALDGFAIRQGAVPCGPFL